MFKKTMKWKLIGISIFTLLVFSILMSSYGGKRGDYHIVDYDFYLDNTYLYAFVIEGDGVEKHNEINSKDYSCGNRVLVFRKSHESSASG